MKMEKLVGERFKEKPSDSIIESHSLMLRGGYMKYVASGIFSLYTPLKRICRKIEAILREEMDAIDGQEVMFPVVLPASLWEESGRYQSVGSELMRMRDRNKSPLVLGMTHEEASVQLVREYGQTYNKYPFMIYQIQTKFRDEPRPRAGLIRAREFTMMDAYSFHTSPDDLEAYYKRCYSAYNRIFTRVGLPETIAVASDTGMMGGSLAHEFMLLTPVGEDDVVICSSCGYQSNMEAAECIISDYPDHPEDDLTLVSTPFTSSIEDVCKFFNVRAERTCKAVVYGKAAGGGYVAVFIRGDYEVNEIKLINFLGEEIYPATLEDGELSAGAIGPYKLDSNITVLFDRTLENSKNLICGGNIKEHHYTGFNIARDCPNATFHDFAKVKENGICPNCGNAAIKISRGIELGHIFQLGDKYTTSMCMQYTDQNGELRYPIMGCYGIGVGRLAASVCEVRHDDYGPVWPISIAPWQVHICALRPDVQEVRAFSEKLYYDLQLEGVEVVFDDRNVSAGVMFSDADLLGIPVRVIVSPRNLKESVVEIITRDKLISMKSSLDSCVNDIKTLISSLFDELK